MGPARAVASALFEYVGSRALVVTGPGTGAVYRFGFSGAMLAVHGLDAAALMAVPGLRLVRSTAPATRTS